jgi:hypothetical protein
MTGSHYVTQAGFEFVIFWTQLLKCCNYRHVPPCQTERNNFKGGKIDFVSWFQRSQSMVTWSIAVDLLVRQSITAERLEWSKAVSSKWLGSRE